MGDDVHADGREAAEASDAGSEPAAEGSGADAGADGAGTDADGAGGSDDVPTGPRSGDDAAEAGADPLVAPATKSAVLWGVAGALTFGVLYQAYVLAGADFVGAVLLGGMLVVGVLTGLAARRLEPLLYRLA